MSIFDNGTNSKGFGKKEEDKEEAIGMKVDVRRRTKSGRLSVSTSTVGSSSVGKEEGICLPQWTGQANLGDVVGKSYKKPAIPKAGIACFFKKNPWLKI